MRRLRMYVKWKGRFQKLLVFILLFFLCIAVYKIGYWGYYGVSNFYHYIIKDDAHDAYNSSTKLNEIYRFYENGGHSYIRDIESRKKVLKDICWIAGAENREDSLLCFAAQSYRGYFNRNSGQVDIPADRYKKAWLFSERLAAVMESDSTLKFINPSGKIVIDSKIKYAPLPAKRGYIFKNGNCMVSGNNHLWGLIDKGGKWSVNPEYDDIVFTDKNCWICYKDGKQGLLNDKLQLVVKPNYREVLVTDDGIEVLEEDFNRKLLDYNGDVLERHMYTNIRDLYYMTKVIDPEIDEYEFELTPYKEYQTTYSSTNPKRVGLMGPNGIPVTPPLYTSIEAVNANCFRCFYDEPGRYSEDEGASILINNKGQRIE